MRSCDQVVASTSPVFFSPRLPWKPLTPVTVVVAYVPVIAPEYQSRSRSRTCSSRTFSPLSPFSSSRAGFVLFGWSAAGLVVGLEGPASVPGVSLAEGAAVAVRVGVAAAVVAVRVGVRVAVAPAGIVAVRVGVRVAVAAAA